MRAIITFLTAALLAGPALARVTQDGPIQDVVVGQDQTEVTARRLELAERYAELMELERVITEMTQAIGQGYLDSLAKSREVDRLVALETEDLLPLFEEHFRSRYCARAECPKLTPTN